MRVSLKYKFGFTMIELVVVLGILAILTVIVLNSFIDFRKGQGLQKDTETVVEILRQARSETLSSRNSSQYGVHIASSKITLFTGTAYSAGDSSNRDFTLVSSDTVLTINLTGGGNDVVFARLSGTTDQNGTVTLSSPTISKTKTVTIYKTGTIESN